MMRFGGWQMQKERAPTCKGGQDPRSLSNLKQYNMQKTVPVQERNYKALKETAKKWRNYVQSCRRAKEKKANPGAFSPHYCESNLPVVMQIQCRPAP